MLASHPIVVASLPSDEGRGFGPRTGRMEGFWSQNRENGGVLCSKQGFRRDIPRVVRRDIPRVVKRHTQGGKAGIPRVVREEIYQGGPLKP